MNPREITAAVCLAFLAFSGMVAPHVALTAASSASAAPKPPAYKFLPDIPPLAYFRSSRQQDPQFWRLREWAQIRYWDPDNGGVWIGDSFYTPERMATDLEWTDKPWSSDPKAVRECRVGVK